MNGPLDSAGLYYWSVSEGKRCERFENPSDVGYL